MGAARAMENDAKRRFDLWKALGKTAAQARQLAKDEMGAGRRVRGAKMRLEQYLSTLS